MKIADDGLWLWVCAWIRWEARRRDNASWAARLRRLANDDPLPGEHAALAPAA